MATDTFNSVLSGWESINSALQGTAEAYNTYQGGGSDPNTARTPAPGTGSQTQTFGDAQYPERPTNPHATARNNDEGSGTGMDRMTYLAIAGGFAALLGTFAIVAWKD